MNVTSRIKLDEEMSSKNKQILSLLLIFITILLFWVPNYYTGRRFITYDLSQIPLIGSLFLKGINLKPELIHGILGILLITPLYLRGILGFKKESILNLLNLALNLSLSSTIAFICLGNPSNSFFDAFWPIKDIKLLLLFTAILLSWLGVKEISKIAYILLFVLVFLNVTLVSHSMGFNGFLCVLFGTLGLVLQSNISLQEIKSSMAK